MRRLDSDEQARRARPKKLKRPSVAGSFLAFLREKAGNATTETVIMIPVFIAIWGGTVYTQQRYRHAINMAQYTRGHVWQHAFDSCNGSPPSSTEISEDIDMGSEGLISGATSLLFGSGILPGFQFTEIQGNRDTSVERPAVLGEGNVTMRHSLVVMCNEQTQGDRGFAEVAWEMFFG